MKVLAQPEMIADPSPKDSAQQPLGPAMWKVPHHCQLCHEKVEVLSNFRASEVECPNCGVRFTLDPALEPLPVPGLRLRFAEVLDAQQRDGWGREAPLSEPLVVQLPQRARTHHLRTLSLWLLTAAIVALAIVGYSSSSLPQ